MKLEGPERFRLSMKPFEITCADGGRKLSAEARSVRPKLYIVSVKEMPIYVGITRQNIRSRLRYGLSADGAHGYHGYPWRDRYSAVWLDLWCQTDAGLDRPTVDIETVEAEVVYLIRQHGHWPAFQTEIHFHRSTPTHRAIAESIWKHYRLEPPR
jgi:hypothetical protein